MAVDRPLLHNALEGFLKRGNASSVDGGLRLHVVNGYQAQGGAAQYAKLSPADVINKLLVVQARTSGRGLGSQTEEALEMRRTFAEYSTVNQPQRSLVGSGFRLVVGLFSQSFFVVGVLLVFCGPV